MTEELQEEAQEEGGFDSAHASSPILTNAKNSEASTRKARRKCKKMEEKIEKLKRKKRIKRIFCRHERRKSPRRCKGMITGVSKRAKSRYSGSQEGREDQKKSQQEKAEGTDFHQHATEII